MKITKGLFKTEISFKVDEIPNMINYDRFNQVTGLLIWIKKTFGLDLIPRPKK